MSFCCPIHGYYEPTAGVSVALCPKCSPAPTGHIPAPDPSFSWTHIVHTCQRCGASWYAPKDEPHECVVEGLSAALESIAGQLDDAYNAGTFDQTIAGMLRDEALAALARPEGKEEKKEASS